MKGKDVQMNDWRARGSNSELSDTRTTLAPSDESCNYRGFTNLNIPSF